MTTIADYQGRKFDILAVRGAEPVGSVLLNRTLFDGDSSGAVCTGVQKLVQRWLLAFLTIKGSVRYLPELGTYFMQEAQRSGFRSEVDVASSFHVAMVDVTRTLQNEEDDTWHDEERYDRAELLHVVLSADQLALSVAVYSLAGESRQAILPITTVPIATGVA